MEGGKPESPEKNPRSKEENQQQTQTQLVSYDLLLFMFKKNETLAGETNSVPFHVFRQDHFRSTSGIICGLGSFAVQFGYHFRSGDHLRSGIICGAVQGWNLWNWHSCELFHYKLTRDIFSCSRGGGFVAFCALLKPIPTYIPGWGESGFTLTGALRSILRVFKLVYGNTTAFNFNFMNIRLNEELVPSIYTLFDWRLFFYNNINTWMLSFRHAF